MSDTRRESWLERRLSAQISLRVVLFLAICSFVATVCFGWLVRYHILDGPRFRNLGALAVDIAGTPSTLRALVMGNGPGRSHSKREPRLDGFARSLSTRSNAGEPSDYILAARYLPTDRRYVVQLLRVPDNRPLRTYAPDIEAINRRSKYYWAPTPLFNPARDRTSERYRLSHPLLMEDGGVIFQDAGPLVRIDACNRVRWMIDGIFHHSIERDRIGNIWVPYTPPRSSRAGVGAKFRDDGLAQISPDGKLLSTVFLFDILKHNGLGHLFESQPYNDDPFHLNDIEPVLTSGPHWKADDLFLSLRHLSLVILYRPSTGKVIWFKQGPWRMQHDVNIVDTKHIAIFDNRVTFSAVPEVDGHNSLLIYNLADDTLDTSWEKAMRQNDIRTTTQGRGTMLSNGDAFIEDTENGRLVRLSKDGKLRWDYITADNNKKRLYLAWSRILDPLKDGRAIAAARSTICS